MKSESPEGIGKPQIQSNRKAMRAALHAALGALALGATDIGTSARRDPGPSPIEGTMNLPTHQTKSKPKETPRGLSQEEIEQVGVYQRLLNKMKGVSLEFDAKSAIRVEQFEEFCRELALVCQEFSTRRGDVPYETIFSFEMFTQLEKINRGVNDMTIPMTDHKQYGVPDKWTLPTSGMGDCEDYVLDKFLKLLELGFDPAKLHILIVDDRREKDKSESGHAVLAVDVYFPTTKQWSTLILDNLRNDIVTIEEAEQYYKGMYASALTIKRDGKHVVYFYDYLTSRQSPASGEPSRAKNAKAR